MGLKLALGCCTPLKVLFPSGPPVIQFRHNLQTSGLTSVDQDTVTGPGDFYSASGGEPWSITSVGDNLNFQNTPAAPNSPRSGLVFNLSRNLLSNCGYFVEIDYDRATNGHNMEIGFPTVGNTLVRFQVSIRETDVLVHINRGLPEVVVQHSGVVTVRVERPSDINFKLYVNGVLEYEWEFPQDLDRFVIRRATFDPMTDYDSIFSLSFFSTDEINFDITYGELEGFPPILINDQIAATSLDSVAQVDTANNEALIELGGTSEFDGDLVSFNATGLTRNHWYDLEVEIDADEATIALLRAALSTNGAIQPDQPRLTLRTSRDSQTLTNHFAQFLIGAVGHPRQTVRIHLPFQARRTSEKITLSYSFSQSSVPAASQRHPPDFDIRWEFRKVAESVCYHMRIEDQVRTFISGPNNQAVAAFGPFEVDGIQFTPFDLIMCLSGDGRPKGFIVDGENYGPFFGTGQRARVSFDGAIREKLKYDIWRCACGSEYPYPYPYPGQQGDDTDTTPSNGPSDTGGL